MRWSLWRRELKKGSSDLIVLALLEARPRHGYDIGKLIERESHGGLRFNVASLYPLLYKLESRGWIAGRWSAKAGQPRRRLYRLTAQGRKVLNSKRSTWRAFAQAVGRLARVEL